MNLIKRLFRKSEPTPVAFPQVNFTYTKPDGLTDEQCGSLPCYRSETLTVSCWRLSPRDRLRCLMGGKVWLLLMMNGHPPVCVTPESPFQKKTEPKATARGPFFWAGVAFVILHLFLFNYLARL
jgi:hypothetical protein